MRPILSPRHAPFSCPSEHMHSLLLVPWPTGAWHEPHSICFRCFDAHYDLPPSSSLKMSGWLSHPRAALGITQFFIFWPSIVKLLFTVESTPLFPLSLPENSILLKLLVVIRNTGEKENLILVEVNQNTYGTCGHDLFKRSHLML